MIEQLCIGWAQEQAIRHDLDSGQKQVLLEA